MHVEQGQPVLANGKRGIVYDARPEIFGGIERVRVEVADKRGTRLMQVPADDLTALPADAFPTFAIGDQVHLYDKIGKIIGRQGQKWVVGFIVSHGSSEAGKNTKVNRITKRAFDDSFMKLCADRVHEPEMA